ncbi:fibronectin type III domain protein [Kribbella amoyensis]|uniref:Fibronectin type III domain protein n=1 Tax=Kribbella amoyensis TaxID=996641 RepID=A0A561BR06_9ACTN|nr:fibronectin type III domain-containing protein [Kribbella amoyensis]TWD81310.1 fibronectin type III domain protein [Kribbella amoyensis]
MHPFTELRRRFTQRDRAAEDGRGRVAETRRARAALAAVVAGCVAVTGIAVAGAGNAAPGVTFSNPGRYIYNSTLGRILHVNGETKNVDTQIPLPGAGPGTQVVENDQNGYVLARGRTYEFGKSSLEVGDPVPAPLDELPVGLEAGAAAFAVYRENGRIVRFSGRPAVADVGVELGQPVVTGAGTLWVHRPDNGQLCQLTLEAERLACPAKVPVGHSGSLVVVGNDRVVFVDTTGREMYAVDDDGLGRQIPLPVADLGADAMIAANDVGGRLAIVDRGSNVLHLVGTTELTDGKPDTEPIRKPLRKGKYERIASSGTSLALIDDTSSTLLTLDRNGEERAAKTIPAPSAKAKVGPDDKAGLYRGGDSRLYVANRSGEKVMLVDDSGDVAAVDTSDTGRPVSPKPDRPKVAPTTRPTQPPQPPQTQEPPVPPKTKKPEPPRRPQDRPTQADPPDKPGNDTTERPPTRKPAKPTTRPTPDKPSPPAKPVVRAGRPGAPRSVSGKAGTNSAFVSWDAAAANGASVTKYQVTWSGGSRTLSASARSVTLTGLTGGTGYVFTVKATNRVGVGPGASTARIVPTGGAADAPVLRVSPGDKRITVTWSRPDTHGGTLVRYQARIGGPAVLKSWSGTTTSHTFTGLSNGDTYLVEVWAVTRDASGKEVQGKTASRAVDAGGSSSEPQLTASRGAATSHGSGDEACEPPGCAFIKVVGTGLQPNTRYNFQPYTTQWQPSNPGATLRTDADGNITIDDRFATDAPGQQVWVVATDPDGNKITSNRFRWPS